MIIEQHLHNIAYPQLFTLDNEKCHFQLLPNFIHLLVLMQISVDKGELALQ